MKEEFDYNLLETQLMRVFRDEDALQAIIGYDAVVGEVLALARACMLMGHEIDIHYLKYHLIWESEYIWDDLLEEIFEGYDFSNLYTFVYPDEVTALDVERFIEPYCNWNVPDENYNLAETNEVVRVKYNCATECWVLV